MFGCGFTFIFFTCMHPTLTLIWMWFAAGVARNDGKKDCNLPVCQRYLFLFLSKNFHPFLSMRSLPISFGNFSKKNNNANTGCSALAYPCNNFWPLQLQSRHQTWRHHSLLCSNNLASDRLGWAKSGLEVMITSIRVQIKKYCLI